MNANVALFLVLGLLIGAVASVPFVAPKNERGATTKFGWGIYVSCMGICMAIAAAMGQISAQLEVDDRYNWIAAGLAISGFLIGIASLKRVRGR